MIIYQQSDLRNAKTTNTDKIKKDWPCQICPIGPGWVSSIIADKTPSTKQVITTKEVPYSQGGVSPAIRQDNILYVSGCIGVNPATAQLSPADTDVEAELALKNLGEILKAADTNYKNVLKATVHLAHMEDFEMVNQIMRKYFILDYPAVTYYESSGLPSDAKFQIDAIAVIPTEEVPREVVVPRPPPPPPKEPLWEVFVPPLKPVEDESPVHSDPEGSVKDLHADKGVQTDTDESHPTVSRKGSSKKSIPTVYSNIL